MPKASTTERADEMILVAEELLGGNGMCGLLEQMEILANPEAMTAIRAAKAGQTVDLPLSVLDEH